MKIPFHHAFRSELQQRNEMSGFALRTMNVAWCLRCSILAMPLACCQTVIARKVELKAMTPTHSFFSVSGNSLEHLIGISPKIMAYGYHCGINECYAGTSSESSQIKEEHELEEHAAFQLHKAVVRHSFRKIRLHRTLNP